MSAHSGYHFLLTPAEFIDCDCYELLPGCVIRKASEGEILHIKGLIKRTNGNPVFYPPYEYHVRPIEDAARNRIEYVPEPLPPERWQYWVLSWSGSAPDGCCLGAALLLIPKSVEIGFSVEYNSKGEHSRSTWQGPALSSFYELPAWSRLPAKISKSDLDPLKSIYDSLVSITASDSYIIRAVVRFGETYYLPRSSELVVIALFSVIESLVSHAPVVKDSSDSLTHQLRTKLPLLGRRFHPELTHKVHFPSLEEDKLWSKLYSLRSQIVHGGAPRFTHDFKKLGDLNAVIGYLRETAKSLLRLSLKEPQLMEDLKQC